MAAKTANVLARVEPEVKKQAEDILNQLGIPASVVINMLYKQIIIKKGVPFPISLSKELLLARDEMGKDTFYMMMAEGLSEAKANDSRPAVDAIADLKRDIKEWTS